MQFQKNIPLSHYSNYKIGGPAKFFVEVKTLQELTVALAEAKKLNEPIFILGGGCNLLISDAGFNGVVIKIAIGGVAIDENNIATVGAGVLVKDFLDKALEQSLGGWEWAGGLPGTMGGAIWGNAGAFGGETKDSVVSVTSVNEKTGVIATRTNEQCQFGYRSSIFKTTATNEVIVSAQIALKPGEQATLRAVAEDKKTYRKNRQPLEYPNIGSIFKNIPVERVPESVLTQFKAVVKQDPFPVLPVAALTSEAGLKEYRVGGAQVSAKHPNFIVNLGGATAADVKAVMEHIKATIKEKFGIELEQEVIFVG